MQYIYMKHLCFGTSYFSVTKNVNTDIMLSFFCEIKLGLLILFCSSLQKIRLGIGAWRTSFKCALEG